jgi:hypothetical protein
LKEFISIYKREQMWRFSDPEVVELVTKKYLSDNFMKL